MKHGSMLILLASLLFLTACTTAIKSTGSLYGAKYSARPLDAPVEIIVGVPSRPHIVIGDVAATSDGYHGRKLIAGDQVIPVMKAKVREMGGDAGINFKGGNAPIGTTGEFHYSCRGQVIVWK